MINFFPLGNREFPAEAEQSELKKPHKKPNVVYFLHICLLQTVIFSSLCVSQTVIVTSSPWCFGIFADG